MKSVESIEVVPIIAIDEAHDFLKNMINRKSSSISVQKICRIYDGGWWSRSKGRNCIRDKVVHANGSALLITTPVPFL